MCQSIVNVYNLTLSDAVEKGLDQYHKTSRRLTELTIVLTMDGIALALSVQPKKGSNKLKFYIFIIFIHYSVALLNTITRIRYLPRR
jgi:hypothetical protein